MGFRRALRILLFVTCWTIPLVCSKPEDKERSLNEIEDDIDYKTGDISVGLTTPMNNHITTSGKDGNLKLQPTAPTIHSTEAPPKTKKRPKEIDPIDQYLLDELLDIVDEKFTTLSKRLSTLERGVHSIQYYNVRSFRVINTHLHTVDTSLHGLNRQFDHTDQQNKEFSLGIDSIKKEMQDLQSLNTGLFQAIEQNLVHFHKDMQSRLEEMKGDMDKANKGIQEVKNDTNELRVDTENVVNIQTDVLLNTEKSMVMISDVAKGTLFMLNLTEHIQQDVTESVAHAVKTEQAIKTINESVSKLSYDSVEIRNGLSTFVSNISVDDVSRQNLFSRSERIENGDNKQSKVDAILSHETCGRMIQLFEDRLKNFTQVNDQNKQVTCSPNVLQIGGMSFRNQSRRLLRALSTVNDNIYQSVTLYKHTGNLIERVIADAELIASDQLQLRDDLRAYLLNGTLDLFNETLPDVGEFVNFNRKITKDNFFVQKQQQQEECKVSTDLIDEISKLSHNGTLIIELLTELATTSTSAMQLSLSRLEGEVDRLHKSQEATLNNHVFKKVENFARDDPRIGANDCGKDLLNRTEWIYQLTEAIASNTGWIPYLFHSMRFVESQVNKTLKLTNDLITTTNSVTAKQQMQALPQTFLTAEIIKSQSNLNRMLNRFRSTIEDDIAERSKQKCVNRTPEVADLSALTNQSFIMADMMEFVHGTSIKLNRLIPALTNLLGEPEPYITLLNGSNDKEGRVEIYYKGQWGTIPGPLSHVEASYICRRLGYLGGNAVGSGSFGPGSGVFWNLNVTCLRTRWCTAVNHVSDPLLYSHDNDVGVLCDHMIRLEPNENDIELSRHTGKLEIYHENVWRPVCHDGWGRPETEVVCRQLGFREGSATPVKDMDLETSQWLINVTCSDGIDRLDICENGGFVHSGCPSSNYVSMICS